jgi:putative ABC transport system permease protein
MSSILRGNVRMALSGIRGSKWRSALTMLGVIVGIVAVVTVVGIGEGVKRQIAGTMEHFGKDLIIVRPPEVKAANSPTDVGHTDILFGMSGSTSLSVRDAEVVSKTPGVKYSTPLGLVPGVSEVKDKPVQDVIVLAASADAPKVLNQSVAYGGFWSDDEEESNFAVVGRHAAEDLFDEPVPLGRTFTFRGQTFMVRGVFAPFANIPFSPTANFDHAIFIPYHTAAKLTGNTAGMYALLAKPDKPAELKTAISSIRDNLKDSHGGEQDFSVMESRQSLEAGSDVIHLLTVWICAVAVISLLMGGVGIMNTMLLVVTERMHEIGVRKAIGASSRQILGQFVAEAVVISVIGGVIGIAVSASVIGLLNVYTDLKPVLSWPAVGIATGVSVAIGVIFGAIPAIKAARKDPIEALRHE